MNKKIFKLLIDYRIIIIYVIALVVALFEIIFYIKVNDLNNNKKYKDSKYRTLIVYNYDNEVLEHKYIQEDNKTTIIFNSLKEMQKFYEFNKENYVILFTDYDTQKDILNYFKILVDSVRVKKIILSTCVGILLILLFLIKLISQSKYKVLSLLGYRRNTILLLKNIFNILIIILIIISIILLQ